MTLKSPDHSIGTSHHSELSGVRSTRSTSIATRIHISSTGVFSWTMSKGYSGERSEVWHKRPYCSGAMLSSDDEMSLEEAKQEEGIRPCGACIGDEWPDETDEDEDAKEIQQ